MLAVTATGKVVTAKVGSFEQAIHSDSVWGREIPLVYNNIKKCPYIYIRRPSVHF